MREKPKLRKDLDNDYGDLQGSGKQKQWAYEIREIGKFGILRHTPTSMMPTVKSAINQVLKNKNDSKWYIDNRMTFNHWLFGEVMNVIKKENKNEF